MMPPARQLEELGVSRESLQRITAYVGLLQEWQARINLIGPATVPDIWTRHILDSLQLLPLIEGPNRSLADLGSGAGLPGLVLALTEGITAELYESNAKKAAFLQEAIRQTGANACVHRLRVEELAKSGIAAVPAYVTARALAPMPQLLTWASPFLIKGSIGLFHKGRDADLELTEAAQSWTFQATKHASRTDPNGAIVEIRGLTR